MNRSILVCALMVAAAASITAQQAAQSDPYQGTSAPPSNDTIIVEPPADAVPAVAAPVAAPAAAAKPSPVHRYEQAQDQVQAQAQTVPVGGDGTDNGIVQVAPDPPAGPTLRQRIAADPDGDIVHPAPLAPNELGEGTSIRVRLLTAVSSNFSQDGEAFRSTVASDVLQDGRVLIPAGSEIDGRITNVSKGSFGGHGSMNLVPETVILPDGSRFRMYAQVTATPGSNTKIGSEGSVNPGSQLKRDSIEYGGAVGAGAVTGGVLGGPVGVLAGSLVGAGVITAHLLINHPQAALNEGTYLQFMLTERLNLVPAATNGN